MTAACVPLERGLRAILLLAACARVSTLTAPGSHTHQHQHTHTHKLRKSPTPRFSSSASAAENKLTAAWYCCAALVDGNGDTKLFAGSHVLRVWHGSGDGPTDRLERTFVVKETAMLRKLVW